MARPLRIEYPGALYHVTSRGNGSRDVFLDDDDRRSFLGTVAFAADRFGWRCYAYCLLDGLYHLLLETPQPNLSRGMRQLNGIYTQHFNRRHGVGGHVFQGRFKAVLVQRERYLEALCRDVVLDPVRAKVSRRPETYPWSSYRATAGLEPAPAFLAVGDVLGLFARTPAKARERYAAFVAADAGLSSPLEHVRAQVLLGDDAFVARFTPRLSELPRRRPRAERPSLAALLPRAERYDLPRRNAAICRAHVTHGYTLNEIAARVDLHFTTVSRIVARGAPDTPAPDPVRTPRRAAKGGSRRG